MFKTKLKFTTFFNVRSRCLTFFDICELQSVGNENHYIFQCTNAMFDFFWYMRKYIGYCNQWEAKILWLWNMLISKEIRINNFNNYKFCLMIRAKIDGAKLKQKKTDLCEIVVIRIVLSQLFVSRPAFIPWKWSAVVTIPKINQ